LGTRFLPLSKIISKEALPLSDQPLIYYLVREAVLSGIENVIFVNSPSQKDFLRYFQPDQKLEQILKMRKKTLDEFTRQSQIQSNVRTGRQDDAPEEIHS